MELDQCISKRHSIKSYLDKQVSWDLISQLIDAAHNAPSSGNIQNWVFIVVTDDEKRRDLTKASLNQSWMTEAPIHIVVCSDNFKIKKHYENSSDRYIHENCAAAIQNLLLKATDLGLGACWVGSFNPEMVEQVIEAKENIEAIAIITVGYPAEKPISQRHKIEELTFFERYGNRIRDTSIFPLEKTKNKLENKIEKSVSKLKKIKK